MGKRIEVGVLGATGMVGQQFIQQLAGHPWFELTWLAASERSEGKSYADAAPWRLETPKFLRPLVRQSFQATALPAIFGAGIVVGLCTVPCTGGIYLGILSLISAQPTYGIGVAYLFLYNVMFITPLLAVLGVASNRRALALLARWHGENRFRIRLALGAAMILLGLLSLAVLT